MSILPDEAVGVGNDYWLARLENIARLGQQNFQQGQVASGMVVPAPGPAEPLARKNWLDAFGDWFKAPYVSVPYLNALEMVDSGRMLHLSLKAKRGEADQDDLATLQALLAEQNRKRTWGYNTVATILRLPAYAGEFMTAGGFLKAGAAGALKSGLLRGGAAFADEAAEIGLGLAMRGGLNAKWGASLGSKLAGKYAVGSADDIGYKTLKWLANDWQGAAYHTIRGFPRAYQAGDTATRAALRKALRSDVGRAVGQSAAEALPRALLGPMPLKSAISYAQPGMYVYEGEDKQLRSVLTEDGDAPLMAILKGVSDASIENFSEGLGVSLSGAIAIWGQTGAGTALRGGLLSMASKARVINDKLIQNQNPLVAKSAELTQAAAKLVSKYWGGPGMSQTATRMGWDGMISEIYEERGGQALRIMMGLERMPTAEEFFSQLSSEIVAFSLNPAAAFGVVHDEVRRRVDGELRGIQTSLNKIGPTPEATDDRLRLEQDIADSTVPSVRRYLQLQFSNPPTVLGKVRKWLFDRPKADGIRQIYQDVLEMDLELYRLKLMAKHPELVEAEGRDQDAVAMALAKIHDEEIVRVVKHLGGLYGAKNKSELTRIKSFEPQTVKLMDTPGQGVWVLGLDSRKLQLVDKNASSTSITRKSYMEFVERNPTVAELHDLETDVVIEPGGRLLKQVNNAVPLIPSELTADWNELQEREKKSWALMTMATDPWTGEINYSEAQESYNAIRASNSAKINLQLSPRLFLRGTRAQFAKAHSPVNENDVEWTPGSKLYVKEQRGGVTAKQSDGTVTVTLARNALSNAHEYGPAVIEEFVEAGIALGGLHNMALKDYARDALAMARRARDQISQKMNVQRATAREVQILRAVNQLEELMTGSSDPSLDPNERGVIELSSKAMTFGIIKNLGRSDNYISLLIRDQVIPEPPAGTVRSISSGEAGSLIAAWSKYYTRSSEQFDTWVKRADGQLAEARKAGERKAQERQKKQAKKPLPQDELKKRQRRASPRPKKGDEGEGGEPAAGPTKSPKGTPDGGTGRSPEGQPPVGGDQMAPPFKRRKRGDSEEERAISDIHAHVDLNAATTQTAAMIGARREIKGIDAIKSRLRQVDLAVEAAIRVMDAPEAFGLEVDSTLRATLAAELAKLGVESQFLSEAIEAWLYNHSNNEPKIVDEASYRSVAVPGGAFDQIKQEWAEQRSAFTSELITDPGIMARAMRQVAEGIREHRSILDRLGEFWPMIDQTNAPLENGQPIVIEPAIQAPAGRMLFSGNTPPASEPASAPEQTPEPGAPIGEAPKAPAAGKAAAAVAPNEISSDAQGLNAALTNRTELARRKGNLQQSYEVTVRGQTYEDAEAAYQALKPKERMSKAAFDMAADALMREILAEKFRQHPRLTNEVRIRGGKAYLETATHRKEDPNWGGIGRKSRFIAALADAFEQVAQQTKSAPAQKAPAAEVASTERFVEMQPFMPEGWQNVGSVPLSVLRKLAGFTKGTDLRQLTTEEAKLLANAKVISREWRDTSDPYWKPGRGGPTAAAHNAFLERSARDSIAAARKAIAALEETSEAKAPKFSSDPEEAARQQRIMAAAARLRAKWKGGTTGGSGETTNISGLNADPDDFESFFDESRQAYYWRHPGLQDPMSADEYGAYRTLYYSALKEGFGKQVVGNSGDPAEVISDAMRLIADDLGIGGLDPHEHNDSWGEEAESEGFFHDPEKWSRSLVARFAHVRKVFDDILYHSMDPQLRMELPPDPIFDLFVQLTHGYELESLSAGHQELYKVLKTPLAEDLSWYHPSFVENEPVLTEETEVMLRSIAKDVTVSNPFIMVYDHAGRLSELQHAQRTDRQIGQPVSYQFINADGKQRQGFLLSSLVTRRLQDLGLDFITVTGLRDAATNRRSDETGFSYGDGRRDFGDFGDLLRYLYGYRDIDDKGKVRRHLDPQTATAVAQRLAKLANLDYEIGDVFVPLGKMGTKQNIVLVRWRMEQPEEGESWDDFISRSGYAAAYEALEEKQKGLMASPQALAGQTQLTVENQVILGMWKLHELVYGGYKNFKNAADFAKRVDPLITGGVTLSAHDRHLAVVFDDGPDKLFDGAMYSPDEFFESIPAELGGEFFPLAPKGVPVMTKAHIAWLDDQGRMVLFKPLISNLRIMGEAATLGGNIQFKRFAALHKIAQRLSEEVFGGREVHLVPASTMKVGRHVKVVPWDAIFADAEAEVPAAQLLVTAENAVEFTGRDASILSDESVSLVASYNRAFKQIQAMQEFHYPEFSEQLYTIESAMMEHGRAALEKKIEKLAAENKSWIVTELMNRIGANLVMQDPSVTGILMELLDANVSEQELLYGIERRVTLSLLANVVGARFMLRNTRLGLFAGPQGNANWRDTLRHPTRKDRLVPGRLDANLFHAPDEQGRTAQGWYTEDSIAAGLTWNRAEDVVAFLETNKKDKIIRFPWMFEPGEDGSFTQNSPVRDYWIREYVNEKAELLYTIPGEVVIKTRLPASSLQFINVLFLENRIGPQQRHPQTGAPQAIAIAISSKLEQDRAGEDNDRDVKYLQMARRRILRENDDGSFEIGYKLDLGEETGTASMEALHNRRFNKLVEMFTTTSDVLEEARSEKIDVDAMIEKLLPRDRAGEIVRQTYRPVNTRAGQADIYRSMEAQEVGVGIAAAMTTTMRYAYASSITTRESAELHLGESYDLQPATSEQMDEWFKNDAAKLAWVMEFSNAIVNIMVDAGKHGQADALGFSKATLPIFAAAMYISIPALDIQGKSLAEIREIYNAHMRRFIQWMKDTELVSEFERMMNVSFHHSGVLMPWKLPFFEGGDRPVWKSIFTELMQWTAMRHNGQTVSWESSAVESLEQLWNVSRDLQLLRAIQNVQWSPPRSDAEWKRLQVLLENMYAGTIQGFRKSPGGLKPKSVLDTSDVMRRNPIWHRRVRALGRQYANLLFKNQMTADEIQRFAGVFYTGSAQLFNTPMAKIEGSVSQRANEEAWNLMHLGVLLGAGGTTMKTLEVGEKDTDWDRPIRRRRIQLAEQIDAFARTKEGGKHAFFYQQDPVESKRLKRRIVKQLVLGIRTNARPRSGAPLDALMIKVDNAYWNKVIPPGMAEAAQADFPTLPEEIKDALIAYAMLRPDYGMRRSGFAGNYMHLVPGSELVRFNRVYAETVRWIRESTLGAGQGVLAQVLSGKTSHLIDAELVEPAVIKGLQRDINSDQPETSSEGQTTSMVSVADALAAAGVTPPSLYHVNSYTVDDGVDWVPSINRQLQPWPGWERLRSYKGIPVIYHHEDAYAQEGYAAFIEGIGIQQRLDVEAGNAVDAPRLHIIPSVLKPYFYGKDAFLGRQAWLGKELLELYPTIEQFARFIFEHEYQHYLADLRYEPQVIDDLRTEIVEPFAYSRLLRNRMMDKDRTLALYYRYMERKTDRRATEVVRDEFSQEIQAGLRAPLWNPWLDPSYDAGSDEAYQDWSSTTNIAGLRSWLSFHNSMFQTGWKGMHKLLVEVIRAQEYLLREAKRRRYFYEEKLLLHDKHMLPQTRKILEDYLSLVGAKMEGENSVIREKGQWNRSRRRFDTVVAEEAEIMAAFTDDLLAALRANGADMQYLDPNFLAAKIAEDYEAMRQLENELMNQAWTAEWIAQYPQYLYHVYQEKDHEIISDIYRRSTPRPALPRTFRSYHEAAAVKGWLPITQNPLYLLERREHDIGKLASRKFMIISQMLAQDMDGTPQLVLRISPKAEESLHYIPDDVLIYNGQLIAAQVEDTFHLGAQDIRAEYNRLASKYLDLNRENMSNIPVAFGKRRIFAGGGMERVNDVDEIWAPKGNPARVMRMVTDTRWNNWFTNSVEVFNSVTKSAALMISFFHPWSLAESWVAVGGVEKGNPLFHPVKSWMKLEDVYARIMSGEETPNVAGSAWNIGAWVRAGAKISQKMEQLEDSQMVLFDELLLRFAAWQKEHGSVPGKYSAAATEALARLKMRYDTWLWEKFHPMVKLMSMESLYQERRAQWVDAAMAWRQGTGENPGPWRDYEVRAGIADYVNPAFGGLEFVKYIWATPHARQALGLGIFALDWSLSTLQAAGAGNLGRLGPLKDLFSGHVPGKIAGQEMVKRYWPSMFLLVLFGIPNAIQFALWSFGKLLGGPDDDDDELDVPFTFMNEKGKKMHVDMTPALRKLGWVPLVGYEGAPTGRRRVYMQWGKQAYELGDYVIDPIHRVLTKSSTSFRTLFEISTASTVSGFDLPFKEEPFWPSWLAAEGSMWDGRLLHLAKKIVPFWVLSPMEGQPTGLIAPTSRGASISRSIMEAKRLLSDYATEKKGVQSLGEIEGLLADQIDSARRNGYNAREILLRAKSHVLSDVYAEVYDAVVEGNDAKVAELSARARRVHGKLDGLVQSMEKKHEMYQRPWDEAMEQRVEAAWKRQLVEAGRRIAAE